MSREGALWIGGVSSFLSLLMLCHFSNVGHFLQLENYMDEGFLKSGLEQMGEMNVLSIRKVLIVSLAVGALKHHLHKDNDVNLCKHYLIKDNDVNIIL